ncbi:hypothetical protein ACH5RR_032506 [Cinchona calisaya]|uniref:F-box associated beta-propeller type 1 domain-containing protein n=1 Tax=Cinchona calisaya TaxID=153742 RepID=A0ABD2YKU2_9GENT
MLPEIGSMEDKYMFYRFGYDESNENYKVLRSVCYENRKQIQLYIRRSDSWKRIGSCLYDVVLQENGAYVDRFFYWLLLRKGVKIKDYAKSWSIDNMVIKEHGVVNSWTKFIENPLLFSTPCVIPLCIGKNGEIVTQINRKVFKYNPKKKTFKVIVYKKFEIEMAIYTESNLSPAHPKRKPTAEGRKISKRVQLQN